MKKSLSDYKFHPACLEYDMLPPQELAELKENIRIRGQLDTIKIYKGFIVDGRNRLHCVLELGLEPKFEELPEGTDPWSYVESVNDRRRHESREAREKRREKRVARVVAAREEGKSIRTIAEQEGISPRQVGKDLFSGVDWSTPESEEPLTNGQPAKPQPAKPAPKVVTGRDGKKYPSKKGKRKPKENKPREVLKDKVGNVLPDSCRDAFADATLPNLIDELKQAENSFSQESWTAKAKKLVDHYPFVLITKFVQHAYDSLAELQLAIESLEAGLPHAVCPKCSGKNSRGNGTVCASCRGCGHVPETRYAELKRELAL